jgi:small-conductance mechanosensitive channel
VPPASNERQQTINQIVAASRQADEDFAAQEDILEDRRLEIQDSAGDKFTKEEEAELKKIADLIDVMQKKRQKLALANVQQLNSAAEVQGLIDTMNGINADLKASLDNVQKVAATLKKINAAIKNIDQIVGGLVRILASFK